MHFLHVVSAIVVVSILSVTTMAGPGGPQPAVVEGFDRPQPGEHPRLFFRKADVPALRERAQTPQGQAILDRCRQLMGIDGHPEQPYTLWHGAAAGFLYQATGEQRYADLARQYVDRALAGERDKDRRYSFTEPQSPLRAGPSIYAVALAYDLAYDGWPADYRRKICEAIMNYAGRTERGVYTLERLAKNPRNPNPVSNHLALQTGGAGIAILAIRGDEGADDAKLDEFQQCVDRWAMKVLTEDFGSGGYFAEHAGPGVVASTWTFIPWLQAERVANGRDWIEPFASARWMTLRFAIQTIPTPRGPVYTNPVPMGGYGTELVRQDGGHHGGKFNQGFGAIPDRHVPALRWVYDNFVQPLEHQVYRDQIGADQQSFDIYNYPHRAMFALVNWPFDVESVNPAEVLPKVVQDEFYGQFIFRNRWQDADDTIVQVLVGARTSDRTTRRVMVWGLGQQLVFGNVPPSTRGSGHIGRAVVDHFQAAEDGSGTVSAGGAFIGVDYSGASGADALIVMAGRGADGRLQGDVRENKARVQQAQLGRTQLQILTLSSTGEHPQARVEDERVLIGEQAIRFDGQKVVFERMAPPPRLGQ